MIVLSYLHSLTSNTLLYRHDRRPIARQHIFQQIFDAPLGYLSLLHIYR